MEFRKIKFKNQKFGKLGFREWNFGKLNLKMKFWKIIFEN